MFLQLQIWMPKRRFVCKHDTIIIMTSLYKFIFKVLKNDIWSTREKNGASTRLDVPSASQSYYAEIADSSFEDETMGRPSQPKASKASEGSNGYFKQEKASSLLMDCWPWHFCRSIISLEWKESWDELLAGKKTQVNNFALTLIRSISIKWLNILHYYLLSINMTIWL